MVALGLAVTHTQSRQPDEESLGALAQGRWAAAVALAGLCSQVWLRCGLRVLSSTLARDVQVPHHKSHLIFPSTCSELCLMLRALSGAAEAKEKMQKSELWPCQWAL